MIDKVLALDIRLVNLVTEPVKTSTIIESFFTNKSDSEIGSKPAPEAHYDIKSIHADRFGGTGGYILREEKVLEHLERFIKSYKRGDK